MANDIRDFLSTFEAREGVIPKRSAVDTARSCALPTGGEIKYCHDCVQGSDQWFEIRRGLITASEMKLIITPTLKTASNDKEKAHCYELAAQRISGYTEPSYVGDDMLRGWEDEVEARQLYGENYEPVQETGFVTNDSLGFKIGYSPDGLVGDSGLIEIKSRRQKYHIKTIIENVSEQTIPEEYMIQIQTGLWVTGREWCDFISYSGGLEMVTIRVYPDEKIQTAILAAATEFETRVNAVVEKYYAVKNSGARMLPTVRRIEQEMMTGD